MPNLTIVSDDDTAVSHEDVRSLIDATEPLDVRLDEVHAGPVVGVGPNMEIELEFGDPGFAYVADEEELRVRLEHTLKCAPQDDLEAQTTIHACHIVTFKVTDTVTATRSTIAAWIETNTFFLAYPYVRQYFTEITSAMGMPPVVLGYLKRDEWVFSDRDSSDD